MPVNQNKSLTKGLQVLKEIMNSHDPINANTLCAKLDIDKSTMSRLITTLIGEGFVKYVENTKEIIYADVMGNISKKNRQELIVRKTENLLTQIFTLTHECSYITVLDEKMMLNLNQVDNSSRVLKNRDTIGIHTPLHVNALGKVILAFDDIEASSIELNEYTYKTITGLKRLKVELIKIKEKGYAIEDEEFEHGLRSVGVPYFSSSGEFLGAVGISGLSARLPIDVLEEYAVAIKKLVAKNLINI